MSSERIEEQVLIEENKKHVGFVSACGKDSFALLNTASEINQGNFVEEERCLKAITNEEKYFSVASLHFANLGRMDYMPGGTILFHRASVFY